VGNKPTLQLNEIVAPIRQATTCRTVGTDRRWLGSCEFRGMSESAPERTHAPRVLITLEVFRVAGV